MVAVAQAAGPLGTNANITLVNPSGGSADRRDMWLALQRASARLFKEHRDAELQASGYPVTGSTDTRLGYHRVTQCMRSVWSQDGVQLLHSAQYGKSSVKGVVTCGSWSACPYCSAKISERRRVELQECVSKMRGRGHITVLASFTLPHKAGDDLNDLVTTLNEAYADIKTTWDWALLQKEFGILGPGRKSGKSAVERVRLYSVRSFECTYGYNGFHPHLHPLFFLRAGSDVAEFQRLLRDMWYVRHGGTFAPDANGELQPVDRDRWEHGVVATSNDGKVAEYVAKWNKQPRWDSAAEVTKSFSKGGRGRVSRHYTMLDLLHSYMTTGNTKHGALWVEFGKVMYRRNMLTWSPGLRDYCGLGADVTDEEIAEREDEDCKTVLGTIDVGTWAVICRHELREELFRLADRGDAAALDAWLQYLVVRLDLWHSVGGVKARGLQCVLQGVN